jgi:CheY-like chemotaxis protein
VNAGPGNPIQAAAVQPGAILQSGPPPMAQSGVPMAPRPSGQQGGQGQGQGRKKKKSQQKPPAFQPSPGNSINGSNGNGGNGGGGGKKRSKQKGPRQFVGPMDHSYRIANGNVADGPPSTIPFQGNGHGAYYNDTPSPRGITPSIAADAPTRIFFFIEDLFFLAKIQEASRKLGVKVEFVKGDKDVLARITDSPDKPSLLVFDLNNAAVKPLTVIPKLKAKLKKSVSIIGFLSHLQGDLKMKATEAGCDTVMPRSAFSQSLPNLLRRYGMDEEEDNYPQPMF